MRKEQFPYLIDLHVHTRKYSPCAELLDPLSIDEAMTKRNIQGVVLTEHDVLWPTEELNRLRRQLTNGHRIYRGIEVSCQEGHFLVLGICGDNQLRAGMSLGDLIEITHNMEAAVIWAHPFRPARVGDPCLDPLEVPDAIDAVELYSTKTKEQEANGLRELALLRHWHVVAGSDAHSAENIGAAVTGFMKLPNDEGELAFEIRQGHTSAMRMPLIDGDK